MLNLHVADNDPRPYRILVDYTKAYDSPDFANIRLSWQLFGLPRWLQRLLGAMYTTSAMQCRLCVNGEYGELIHRSKGLYQGAVLSPHLFNVYLDPLLQDMNVPHHVLNAFADDLLLFADDRDDASYLLAKVHDWSTMRRLDINPKKSVILGPPGPPLMLPSDEEIVIKESATYLGVRLTRNGIDWPAHYEEKLTKGKRQLYLMMHLTKTWPFTARASIFDTFLRPMLEYASDLFIRSSLDSNGNITRYQEVWRSLLDFQKLAASSIFQKKTFRSFSFSLLNWQTWQHRWHELSLWHQFTYSTPNYSSLPHLIQRFLQDEKSSYYEPDEFLANPPTSNAMRAKFRIYYKFITTTPRSRAFSLHRTLSRDAQHHIYHLLQHTFAYGATCTCGDDFTNNHLACLPQPFGSLDHLFDTTNWSAIETTLNTWWSILS